MFSGISITVHDMCSEHAIPCWGEGLDQTDQNSSNGNSTDEGAWEGSRDAGGPPVQSG